MRPVLYVDDSVSDAKLMQLVFEEAGFPEPLQIAMSGREAIDYLSGDGRYADRDRFPMPVLVLLDLNMPMISGFEILQWIGAHSEFQQFPVVVYSSSSQPSDVERARELGASDYFVKPCLFDKTQELLREIRQKWLSTGIQNRPLNGSAGHL